MATTVIQKIERTEDGKRLVIAGTVGGTAHLMPWDHAAFFQFGSFNLNLTPQQLAQKFADDFNVRAAIVTAITSATVTLAPPMVPTSIAVAFDGSTPLTEIGIDYEEIKGTVNSVTTYCLIRRDVLYALYQSSLNPNASVNFTRRLAQMLAEQYNRDILANTSGSDYIASFTTT